MFLIGWELENILSNVFIRHTEFRNSLITILFGVLVPPFHKQTKKNLNIPLLKRDTSRHKARDLFKYTGFFVRVKPIKFVRDRKKQKTLDLTNDQTLFCPTGIRHDS